MQVDIGRHNRPTGRPVCRHARQDGRRYRCRLRGRPAGTIARPATGTGATGRRPAVLDLDRRRPALATGNRPVTTIGAGARA